MGDVLEDLTKASLDKIEKYVKPILTKASLDKIEKYVKPILTKASLDKIEKYVKPAVVAPVVAAAEGEAAPAPAPEPVRTLDMARERGDWLFIFEAARATHLDAGDEEDLVLFFEKRKQQEDCLSKLKHVSGDFNRWISLVSRTRSRFARQLGWY